MKALTALCELGPALTITLLTAAVGVARPVRFRLPRLRSSLDTLGGGTTTAADDDDDEVEGGAASMARAIAVATFLLVTMMGARPGGLAGVRWGSCGSGGVNDRFRRLCAAEVGEPGFLDLEGGPGVSVGLSEFIKT